MESRRVVIEFFGMPGAGKSTLAERLCWSELARGRSVGRRGLEIDRMSSAARFLAKFAQIVRLWMRKPIMASRSAAFVMVRTGLLSPFPLRVVGQLWYLLSLIERELAEHGSVILDQGIGQALWSTYFRADSRPGSEEIGEFLSELLRRTDISRLLVVYVRADSEVVGSRLRNRTEGGSPLNGDDPSGRQFQAAERVIGLLAQDLSRASRNHPKIEFLECVNHGNVDEVIEGLREDLPEWANWSGTRHREDLR